MVVSEYIYWLGENMLSKRFGKHLKANIFSHPRSSIHGGFGPLFDVSFVTPKKARKLASSSRRPKSTSHYLSLTKMDHAWWIHSNTVEEIRSWPEIRIGKKIGVSTNWNNFLQSKVHICQTHSLHFVIVMKCLFESCESHLENGMES